MAFTQASLQKLCGGGTTNTLYMYVETGTAKATMDSSGYFNDASNYLAIGDYMFIRASDGYGIAVVTGNSGGVVDITDLTAIGGTDTD